MENYHHSKHFEDKDIDIIQNELGISLNPVKGRKKKEKVQAQVASNSFNDKDQNAELVEKVKNSPKKNITGEDIGKASFDLSNVDTCDEEERVFNEEIEKVRNEKINDKI